MEGGGVVIWVQGALSRVSQLARPVGHLLTFQGGGGHSASWRFHLWVLGVFFGGLVNLRAQLDVD